MMEENFINERIQEIALRDEKENLVFGFVCNDLSKLSQQMIEQKALSEKERKECTKNEIIVK